MHISVIYDNTYGLDDIKFKRITDCIAEASCPNEALRSVTHRYKKMTMKDKTFVVYLDFDNVDEANSKGAIRSIDR